MTAGPSPSQRSEDLSNRTASSPPVLSYAAPQWRLTAGRIRWLILLASGFLLFLALLFNPIVWQWDSFGWGILGTPLGPIENIENGPLNDTTYYALHAIGFLGLFLLTQWLFLLPRGRLSLQSSTLGRSRRAAAIGAGFIGMLLTAGLAASIMELAHVWQSWLSHEFHLGRILIEGLYPFLGAMALAWLIWAVVFYVYYRDADHRTAVARLTRLLLAGSVLELLVSVPAYVRSLQEPDNCYCAKGSYTGLVFGCTALFWLFGPGVYLLMLRENRRWTPKV